MKLWARINKLSFSQLWQLSVVFLKHPLLIMPTLKATKDTFAICNQLYGNQHHKSNRANAFRHALWNVLICNKSVNTLKNKQKSVFWAQKVTDLYEKVTQNEPMDEAMEKAVLQKAARVNALFGDEDDGLDEKDLNEFICGILKKIGNKHYSSQETTQRMLAQLRESLYHLMRGNFGYKAPDIKNKFDPYLIDCMVQCLASGMYSKLNETDGSILQRMYDLKVHGSSHLTTDAAGDIQASYEKYFQQLSEMPDKIRIDIATAFEMTNKGQLVDLDKKIRHKVKELHALTEQNVKDSARRSPSMAKGGKRTRRRHKPRKHTKRKHKGKKTTKRRKTSNRKHKKAKTRHR